MATQTHNPWIASSNGPSEVGADWATDHRSLSDDHRNEAVNYIVTIIKSSAVSLENANAVAIDMWQRFRSVYDGVSRSHTDSGAFTRAMRQI
jgi:hypothetical protein